MLKRCVGNIDFISSTSTVGKSENNLKTTILSSTDAISDLLVRYVVEYRVHVEYYEHMLASYLVVLRCWKIRQRREPD